MSRELAVNQFELSFLDSLFEQVVVIDAYGRIIWTNDAWIESARLRGADLNTVSMGASYLRVLEDSARADHVVARILDGIKAVLGGKTQRFEEEYECRGPGESYYFIERVTPLKHPAGGAIIAHLDVTKQKLAERERSSRRSELARAASAAALGQFSGAIAHELSQPLTAILSNAQFARAAVVEAAAGDEVASALEEIEHASRRATLILSRVRDLLRKREPRSEVVAVNEAVKVTLALCANELRAHDVDVRLSLSPELPSILGDSIGLQQVMLNLVTNSYEAMKLAELRERRIEISTMREDPRHVAVVVADTGPGLTKEAADRLYDTLFTTKPYGTGLGLSISRSIVESHGGVLSITNRSSEGASAKIVLPIAGFRP